MIPTWFLILPILLALVVAPILWSAIHGRGVVAKIKAWFRAKKEERRRERLRRNRFDVQEIDACMGPETRYTCRYCGSQIIQTHVAQSAGFKGEFSPDYWLSANPCTFCRTGLKEGL